MKKVLLINPPLYYSNGIPFALDVSVPPLGLLYLASYINVYSKDFKAQVIDVAAEELTLEGLVKKIRKMKPFVVGITSMTPQLQGAIELAGFIKKNFKGMKIFLGGPHISADPDFIKRFNNYFDYAVTGEAEKTFLQSLSKLQEGRGIPLMQRGEIVMDLDTLPFPDRTLIKRSKYSEYESLMFSRGCPYHCYYCSRPSISRQVRYRSAENLIEEIKSVYKYGKGKIDFQDDTFTLNQEKVLDFCRLVKKENLKLEWRCNSRIDLVNKEILTAMKEAGCALIHFGIEAGDEKVRQKTVKKGQFTNRQIHKIIRLCQETGIKFAGYFILGHPGEGRREIAKSKKLILQSGINLLGLSIPTPFPGSELYEIAKERGIVNEEIIDKFARKELGEGYVGNYPVFVSEKLSADYIFAQMKEINRKFYLKPKVFWARFKEDVFSFPRLKRDLGDLVALVLRGVSSRKPYVQNKKK